MLVDDFLAAYDVSDAVATAVNADVELAEGSCRSISRRCGTGYAKTTCSFSVRMLDEHRTLLSGLMRTATTDEDARRWFRRYWTYGMGSGAHTLVNGLLDVTPEMAEARADVPDS
jgi:hypothetical protein